jgi:hypothetical protein
MVGTVLPSGFRALLYTYIQVGVYHNSTTPKKPGCNLFNGKAPFSFTDNISEGEKGKMSKRPCQMMK